MKRRAVPIGALLLAVLLFQGCATLGDLAGALANLKRLQFRLGGIGGFSLAGVPIGGKAALRDFNLGDGLRLLAAFRGKRLPASFVLDVEARNPNDGTGGSPRTVSTLTRFEWRLLIDDQPTIRGDIENPVEIPGTGQTTVIPIRLEIDLFEFFGNRGYEDLVSLALAIGGRRGDVSRIALDALPRVSTPLGEIAYPGRITIVSGEFR